MINRIGTVCLFVADQDRAKAFYTNMLGMELHQDQPVYPGSTNRWLSMVPKGQIGTATELILYLVDEHWQQYKDVVGQSQAVTLDVSNLVDFIKDLKSKGVTVTMEPDPQPWGTNAQIKDSEGNLILLVEQPKM